VVAAGAFCTAVETRASWRDGEGPKRALSPTCLSYSRNTGRQRDTLQAVTRPRRAAWRPRR